MSSDVRKLVLYSPHSKQLELHNCPKRFVVAAFGRQAGKSTCAINHMLKRGWDNPGTKYWFVSPTFAQSRIMYRRLVGMLWSCGGAIQKKSDTELRVCLINGSELRFVSGEVLDNLRGETLHGAIIDEVREQHADLWPMVIRPMLATTKGWCWFISTPSGYDHFYDLAQKAKSDDDWAFLSAPSTANPIFSQEEFDAAKRTLSESQFAQEILAEFRSLTAGRVYSSFSQENVTEKCPWYADKPWSPYHPVTLGCDFNVSPMAWTLGQVVNHYWWWFSEIHLNDSNTAEAAKELSQRLLMMREQGHRPADYDIIICGDASGDARSTKGNQTDYEIIKSVLKAHGIKFRNSTPLANPSIRDRVNSVNAKFRSAAGEISMWIHPQCKTLIHDLERLTWKAGADFILDPGPKRDLSHASDSIGYPIAELSPVKQISGKATLKVMARSV